MKKIFIYVLCSLTALAAASSCKVLETESPSTFDGTVVFANYDLAEKAVFGITETLCEVNSYRGRFLPWYGFNTDIEWYNSYKEGDGKSDIAGYNCTGNNAQMNTASNGATNNPWALMYAGIERANLAIEGLRENGNVKSDKKMAYLLGEALTLRAMLYYDLVKAWGDVPARFSSTTSETIYQPKESRDTVFVHILGDLEEAFDYLPYPNDVSDGISAVTRTDRINKAFAKGLYARIALAASGYALRPDDGQVGKHNAGSIRLSSCPALQKSVLYPKALEYLQDVINSGSCILESDYEQMWYNLNNMNNLTAGGETLYVIPFGEGRGRWNFTFAVNSEGASISGGVSRGGDAGPVPTLFFDYAEGDVRRDVTCVNYKWNKDNSITPAGISKWYFGKYRFEWMDAQPYTGGNDDGIKPVVMRYADILLMASEIANELEDLGTAKGYFSDVRARACGESAAEAFLNDISGKEDMFNAIVDERAFEFCGEFLRKGDLIRWNLLKTKMDETVDKLLDLRDLSGDYAYMTGTIYYQTTEDELGITIYGLKPGEQDAPSGEWEVESKYVGAGCYDDTKKPGEGMGISRITLGMYRQYESGDVEAYMYWPIFDCNKTDSQGTLVNDYNYE